MLSLLSINGWRQSKCAVFMSIGFCAISTCSALFVTIGIDRVLALLVPIRYAIAFIENSEHVNIITHTHSDTKAGRVACIVQ
jgi:hypothetical protein